MSPIATLGAICPSAVRPGLLLRLLGWLTAHRQSREVGPGSRCNTAQHDRANAATLSGARLLPFPIRGEALLVKLADLLRDRIGDRGPLRDPFLLELSRAPLFRLRIDQASYIEFEPQRAAYRMAVALSPGSALTLDTRDFDEVVQFVVEYVSGRLSEPSALDIAS